MARNIILAALAGCAATYVAVTFLGNPMADKASNIEAYEQAVCQEIASRDQAEKLLKRLFKSAEILTADELPLSNTKSVCLLEVEMLVEAKNPDTRGFVYVLPDGENFLNGPLMDKRSQVGLSSMTSDFKQALEEQEKKLKEAFGMPAAQQGDAPTLPGAGAPLAPQTSLVEQPTSPQSIPSPAELREKLISKLQVLPSIVSPGEGKPVYVLLDPLCGHCKRLVKSSAELAQKHGVQFHWIPLFLNEGGWALSSLLLKTQKDDPENALSMLDQVMSGQMDAEATTASIKGLTEADYAVPKEATAVFIELAKHNSRLGTPLVVFRKPDGSIEVISGMPHEQDWAGLSSGS